ncbi:YbaB/EbfC family nucleoid-associated protein [Verrucomicrobium sp. BvORR106]|uniref:YbaB/EbfC family nucleoid-associated protein n=1 Tax=Verrucomicrobium sp. BvORR106 TaxID=1403819 RepID=UPI00056F1692|nr:YbaB/EbfC family nucleoid-associated protein [Verrucomicrobium sp. BvORR106]
MNIQKMMKQMQQMQSKMAQTQDDLAGKTMEVSSGGGRVTVTVTGAQEITGIKINKEIVDPEDVDMLETLVLTAVQQALAKSKEMAAGEMGKLTQGMGLPPGMGF